MILLKDTIQELGGKHLLALNLRENPSAAQPLHQSLASDLCQKPRNAHDLFPPVRSPESFIFQEGNALGAEGAAFVRAFSLAADFVGDMDATLLRVAEVMPADE